LQVRINKILSKRLTMNKNQADVVIVGASHGGSEVASQLRHGGFTGSIALIGAESYLPYQRPRFQKPFWPAK
jgi:3-phenylpropionate/trans-cinnamate dioxygenase ferredoxin reductase subunit